MALLHGEQFLALHRPIPVNTPLTSTLTTLAALDKGKATALIFSVVTALPSGDPVCTNEFTLFIRGIGGWGGPRNVDRVGPAGWPNEVPDRDPDAVVAEKTTEEQAVLYRLSGDKNPLHVDPAESKKGGFEVPMCVTGEAGPSLHVKPVRLIANYSLFSLLPNSLHGLCTFGIAGRHILRKYCNSDPANFKSIKVRFAAPVFPGETLETRMWKEAGKVVFVVRVVERDSIVVSGAAVEIEE